MSLVSYYSLNAYFKHTYGQKCYKIAVDTGLTCPNRDGTLDTRGCIFCSGGSGNFAVNADIGSVEEQIRTGLSKFNKKSGERFVIYFQANTNTYGPKGYLRDYFDGKFQVFTEDEYVDVVIQCIQHLDPGIVLHRVTGDGPKALLTAPLWSGNKKQVLNHLHREMKAKGARQGDFAR